MNRQPAEYQTIERAKGHFQLGCSLARVGQVEAALPEFWSAFRVACTVRPSAISPTFRESLLAEFGKLLLSTKRYADALALLKSQFACQTETSASIHYCAGLIHFQRGEYELAAAEMRHCIARRGIPTTLPAWAEVRGTAPNHYLAASLLRLRQPEAALAAFQEGLMLDPSSRTLRIEFASCLNEVGRPHEALAVTRQLLIERPRDAAVWKLGGTIALSQPEYLEFALEWTAAGVEHFPDEPALVAQRAEALLLAGRPLESLRFWGWMEAHAVAGTRAPKIICELLSGNLPSTVFVSEEPAVSVDFTRWYQRLVEAGAREVLRSIDRHGDLLRTVLPTAYREWRAHIEADAA